MVLGCGKSAEKAVVGLYGSGKESIQLKDNGEALFNIENHKVEARWNIETGEGGVAEIHLTPMQNNITDKDVKTYIFIVMHDDGLMMTGFLTHDGKREAADGHEDEKLPKIQ